MNPLQARRRYLHIITHSLPTEDVQLLCGTSLSSSSDSVVSPFCGRYHRFSKPKEWLSKTGAHQQFMVTYMPLSVPEITKHPPKVIWFSSSAHQSKYWQHSRSKSTPPPLTHSSLFSPPIFRNFCLSPSLSPEAGNLPESTAVFGRDIHTVVFNGLKTIFKYFYCSKK